jgi:tetratricopeptide (TPR) repeat protein
MNLRRVAATVVMVASVALGGVARADNAARDKQARELFLSGRDAYNAGDFAKAYDAFRESFSLSHEPALLYNIASALQGLKRPHEAAEALRSYLRLKPDDPDKPQIDQRIRTLEEEQHILDLEHPPVTLPVTPPGPTPSVNSSSPGNALVASAPSHEKERMRRRTGLIVGLTVGAVVVAGVAVGLAIGLQPKDEPLTPSPIGPIKSTQ